MFYRVEKWVGGPIHKDPFSSLAEAKTALLAAGDGRYQVWGRSEPEFAEAPLETWTFGEFDKTAIVSGGKLVGRDLHAADISQRLPAPIHARTVWVVRPGQLAEEGSLRCLGTCLTTCPYPGDQILDTVDIRIEGGEVVVSSERQRKSDVYRFDSEGRPHYEFDRAKFEKITVEARYLGQGSLGDDSYDEQAAIDSQSDCWLEILAGPTWRVAQISYSVQELPQTGEWLDSWNHGEICRIALPAGFGSNWLKSFGEHLDRHDLLLEVDSPPEECEHA